MSITGPTGADARDAPEPGHGRPRLLRSPDNRMIAGVAAGLGQHLGVDPLVLRLAFVALTLAGGLGVLAYGLAWVALPEGPATEARRRIDFRGVTTFAVLGLGVLILLPHLGLGPGPRVLIPLLVGGLGVTLIWRQADEAQRGKWRPAAGRGSRWRVLLGVLLVAAGVGGLLVASEHLANLGHAFVGILIVLVGVLLVLGPWMVGVVRALGDERRERIRSEERAEVAAHLHDSVLHTLALIQRQATDPRDVVRIARAQERDLRAWLYGAPLATDVSLRAALVRVAAEVEDDHGLPIEVVTVGDCPIHDGPLADGIRALLQAAREAMLNAAEHSCAPSVDVYAEVEAHQVVVFVRDRGKGFDPEVVPEDRLGIRHSIVERMARHGGSAQVRSAVGEGTDVRLELRR